MIGCQSKEMCTCVFGRMKAGRLGENMLEFFGLGQEWARDEVILIDLVLG